MEKDEWKEYWDLVLRITKNVVSRDPKNESAKNLIIEAERIAKDEEEKMNPFMKAMLESIITNTANSKQLAKQREDVLKDTFKLLKTQKRQMQ